MTQQYVTHKHIFTSLVRELNQLLDGEVIITNEAGVIMASTDSKRIGTFHEGAKIAMEKKHRMNMTGERSRKLEGVRKGVVLPILIHEEPIAVLGITGEPQSVEPQATLVKKVAELFIQDSMQQMNLEKQARDLEFFVYDWLHRKADAQSLMERAEFFHINIEAYHQVILCEVKEKDVHLTYQDIESIRMLWDQKGDALIVRWGLGKWLLIVKDISDKTLKQQLKQFIQVVHQHMDMHIIVGCGQSVVPEELPLSFEQATRAAEIADINRPLVFEEDMRLEMLLSELDTKTKKQFVARTIRALEKETFLIETLKAWFENNMSISKAATHLHVHKNTLHYRLKRVEQLTGLKTDQVEDLVQLYLGYLLLGKFHP